MYFRYHENLVKEINHKPTIFLHSNNEISDNTKLFSYTFIDFFDRLSNEAINELDKIYNYSLNYTNDYINQDTWLMYQMANGLTICPISKRYTKRLAKHNDKGNGITAIYTKNRKERELIFNNFNDFIPKNANLFDNLAKKGSSIYHISAIKESICNNEIELLYVFLECLYNSNATYCIKKCKHCNKYYIAIKSDNRYCERKQSYNGKMIGCNSVVATIQKSYEYKQLMKKDKNLTNIFSNSSKYSQEYIDNYKDKRDAIKIQCFKNRDLTDLKSFIENYKLENPPY